MFLFNNMLFGTHEEMVALDKSFGRFAEKAGMSMEHAIGAVIHMVEIEGKDMSDAVSDEEDTPTPLPLVCRCRVCGKKYAYKGEAKACERNHKRR